MTLRITGLSTGLDYDSIIKDTLKPYKLKIQAQEQQKQILEWKQEQYQSIMKKANSFYNKYLDPTSSNSLYSMKAYNQTKFTSSDSSIVSVQGSSTASVDNYTVEVTSLASKASSTLSSENLDKLKGEINAKLSVDFGGESSIEFQVTDDSGNLLSNDKILSNFNSAISDRKKEYNDIISKDVELKSIIAQDKKLNGILDEDKKLNDIVNSSTATEEEKKAAQAKLDSEEYKNTLKETEDKLKSQEYIDKLKEANDTLGTNDSTVATEYEKNLNRAKENLENVDISAKYSQFSKGIVFSGKNEGKGDFTISYTSKDASDTAKNIFLKAESSKLEAVITNGRGEKYSVNTLDKNELTLDGVTFTFKDKGTSKVTGAQDVTELKDKIVSFMNDYNQLMGEIGGKLWETYDSDYLPLTDDQRESMSDKQIEQWEKKAQTGLLKRDNDLTVLSENMKDIMSTLMDSTGIDLERIGITPVKDYKDKNGTFEIDEEKLTEALKNNFDDIKDLFMGGYLDDDTKNAGILPKLKKVMYDNFTKYDSVFNKKASTSGVYALTNEMTKQITEKKNLIDEMNDSLKDREDSLYKKYAALETAMSKAQSQQSSMSSWFGSGN